jgi:hypothetical protein
MARRIVMGRMANGSFDLRISRRGYDAYTENVNDFKRISFSAVRQSRAKVASTGVVMSLGSWVNFGKTFANPPPVLAVLKRGGRMFFNYYNNVGNGTPGFWYVTPYCFVVQENRLRVSRTQFQWTTLPSGDGMAWYMLEN